MDRSPSQNKAILEPPRGNQHLELAIKNCAQSWFPVNAQVLQSVHEGIKERKYQSNRESLIADLKSDYALLGSTIKRLVARQAGEAAPTLSPIAMIEQASISDLIEILDVDEEQISTHRMMEVSAFQTQRLKHAMIAATTAEAISDAHDLDPELGYSCGLLRQLGLTLIAWNYPHVYKRVLSTLKPGEKLDAALSKILGFSPNMLGISLAREWGLAPELRAGMGDSTAREQLAGRSDAQTIASGLDQICKVGEALARASDPEHYPSAKQDWSEAKAQIEAALGPEGLKIVRDKLEQNCKAYAKSSPDLFKFNANFSATPQVTTPTTAAGVTKPRDLYKHNHYTKQCSDEVQDKLRALYANVDGITLAKENIDMLCKQILPLAGFTRGCIFLIEPDTQTLVPRLLLGGAAQEKFRTVNYQQPSSEFDPIVSAFRCQYPIMEQNVRIDDREVSYVAGVLGDAQKAGVLYLEIGDQLANDLSANILGTFKALRQALNDCLSLR